MKKEMSLIAFGMLLVGIFALTQMTTYYSTGMAINEVANLRASRLQLYLNFPHSSASDAHRTMVRRIKDGLRLGGQDSYYHTGQGILRGQEFFDGELAVVRELRQAACLMPVQYAQLGHRGSGISVPAVSERQIRDVGYVPCDQELRKASEETLDALVAIDMELVQFTIDRSRCGMFTQQTMRMARNKMEIHDYEAVLNALRVAWSQATYC